MPGDHSEGTEQAPAGQPGDAPALPGASHAVEDPVTNYASALPAARRPTKAKNHLMYSFVVLLRHRLGRELFKQSWERLFGDVVYVRLRLDVGSLRTGGGRRRTLMARPIEGRDHEELASILADQSMARQERHEAARRLVMLAEGIDTCYVVEDLQGNVRFLQWLILPAENDKLYKTYGDWFPRLGPGEAMMESAYVFPRYRGTGILPGGVARILDEARSQGARRILTSVPVWNTNSLGSFIRLGFRPYEIVREKRRLGFRRRQAMSLPASSAEAVNDLKLPANVSRLLFTGGVGRSTVAVP